MNGIHDMGGMHGMGPLRRETAEPVFHEPWEGRVFAMTLAARAGGKGNLDNSRYQLESLPPADYLRMSYYERWFTRLTGQLVRSETVTPEELEAGTPGPGSAKTIRALDVAATRSLPTRRNSARRPDAVEPRFAVGQRVRARTINPVGHTRLPRYARGRIGVVARDHGVFVFPDTNAEFLGEKPQHVYSVRFTARELWGAAASIRDTVHLDLWDDYLDQI
jgi:nitrile hydratase